MSIPKDELIDSQWLQTIGWQECDGNYDDPWGFHMTWLMPDDAPHSLYLGDIELKHIKTRVNLLNLIKAIRGF